VAARIRTKQGQTVALALLSVEKPESMFGEPPLWHRRYERRWSWRSTICLSTRTSSV